MPSLAREALLIFINFFQYFMRASTIKVKPVSTSRLAKALKIRIGIIITETPLGVLSQQSSII